MIPNARRAGVIAEELEDKANHPQRWHLDS